MFFGEIDYRYKRSWRFRKLLVTIEWRKASNRMGRFGGGWQWMAGFRYAKRTLIVELLVLSIRFDRYEGPKQ